MSTDLDHALAGGLAPAPDLLFQPVADLDSGAVVGFEALARDGRTGRLEPPTRLFAQARAAGQLSELDWACRTAALERAREAGLGDDGRRGAALLVNTEPRVAGSPPPPSHLAAEGAAPVGLVRILELTERALAQRLGALLEMVDEARRRGWRIALDDVGADGASLSLLPVLQPDVIKLDLGLVLRRGEVQAAGLIHAVAVQSAATGALVVVEGIETAAQVELARSMGGHLGQGYFFGRPAALPAAAVTGSCTWPRLARPHRPGTPWQQVAPGAAVRQGSAAQLLRIAQWLEREAVALGESALVLATFQHGRHFTGPTADRYRILARSASIVGVLAQDMPAQPAPGVRAAALPADDPLCAEWDVVVVGPHFTGALLARECGDPGPDGGRRFDYVVTYDSSQVLAAAADLLRRLPDLLEEEDVPPGGASSPRESAAAIPTSSAAGPSALSTARPVRAPVRGQAAPRHPGPPVSSPPQDVRDDDRVVLDHLGSDLAPVLARALAGAGDGLAISDATSPDLPLVYVNAAYERLSGYSAAALLGRNPRMLQAPGTDPGAVRALRTSLEAGTEARVTLLNARPDGARWWNELHLVPVHDAQGRLTHWIATQQDVTGRTDAQQQAAYLAHHDPLTGLANRRRLVEHLPAEIGRASRTSTSLALLYLDLDSFKDVNDRYGHGAGDELLAEVAARLRLHRRVGDLLVRQGGDEFLLVLSGLPHEPEQAYAAARSVADKIHAELRRPYVLDPAGPPVTLGVSIGISHCPYDAQDAAKMLDHADRALYEVKRQGRDGTRTFGQGRPKAVGTDPAGRTTPATAPQSGSGRRRRPSPHG